MGYWELNFLFNMLLELAFAAPFRVHDYLDAESTGKNTDNVLLAKNCLKH